MLRITGDAALLHQSERQIGFPLHRMKTNCFAANYVAEDNDYLVPVYVVKCNLVAQLIFIFLYKDVINEKAN